MNYASLTVFQYNQKYKWKFLYDHLCMEVSYTIQQTKQWLLLILNTPNNDKSQNTNITLAYSLQVCSITASLSSTHHIVSRLMNIAILHTPIPYMK